jgi:hypothetical protein
MRSDLTMLLTISLLSIGCGKSDTPVDGNHGAQNGAINPATAPLDYLSAQGKAKQAAIRVVSLAEVTQAIQKFQAMEDRNPKDINELVQQRYLHALPEAPRGARLAYDPVTGNAAWVRAAP